MKSLFALSALLLPFAAFACAHDETVVIHNDGGAYSSTLPTDTADLDGFCGDICTRQTTCDSTLDNKTCVNTCRNGYAASFGKLRPDYVQKVETCVQQTSCKTLQVGTCLADSIAELAPSDAALSFCNAIAASKCGLGQSKAQCLDAYKQFSDDALADAQSCTNKACSQVPSCIAAVFGAATSSSPKGNTDVACTTSTYSDLPGTCSTCAANSCCSQATACAADSQCRALMSVCTQSSAQSSSCQAAYNAVSSTTRSLLTSYFDCASSSCQSSCWSAL